MNTVMEGKLEDVENLIDQGADPNLISTLLSCSRFGAVILTLLSLAFGRRRINHAEFRSKLARQQSSFHSKRVCRSSRGIVESKGQAAVLEANENGDLPQLTTRCRDNSFARSPMTIGLVRNPSQPDSVALIRSSAIA